MGSLIINIDVPDLDVGVSFYTTALGFALRRFLFNRTVAEPSGSAVRLFLLLQPAGSIAVRCTTVTRNYSDHWTPVHLDIGVEDLDAAVARAIAAGAVPSGSVADHVFGRMVGMRDPFGHGFCLIEFNELGYETE